MNEVKRLVEIIVMVFCQKKILNVQVYVEVELVSGNIIVIMTVANINVKGVKDTIR